MNYQDEERELDAEIRAELRRLKEASRIPVGSPPNPTELRSIFRQSTIRRIVRKLPVSSYIRKVRTYADATTENFATALNVSPQFIRELETNESEPWTLPPAVMAKVAEGLRIHITALEGLTKNSHTVASLSRTLADPQTSAQLMANWLSDVRSEIERRDANDLLD